MKNRASSFLKQVLTVLSTVVKAKSMAIKTKTTAIKTRLVIFSLLKNKKVLVGSISHKIHALIGHHLDINNKHKQEDNEEEVSSDQNKAIVLYNAMENYEQSQYPNNDQTTYYYYQNDDDDKYPDLTHSLFDSDGDEFDDQTGSVIDLVRNAKEEDGENFSLEDEIDHVADLFIKRFHRQMRLQKQESFKRYQEMLERSV